MADPVADTDPKTPSLTTSKTAETTLLTTSNANSARYSTHDLIKSATWSNPLFAASPGTLRPWISKHMKDAAVVNIIRETMFDRVVTAKKMIFRRKRTMFFGEREREREREREDLKRKEKVCDLLWNLQNNIRECFLGSRLYL
ncbi:hypothetical protein RHMOL_Rhmol13G0062600 [Rhododendron molle]|uniref:Uncharacterized protein n=1 Tax=Rhododendron molle TaxID=49168 RepID=A0ACC0L3K8_RHOML|nr:hypothetical protein RHMOL_Rhmol13G0062600 [Rhododendron molle]